MILSVSRRTDIPNYYAEWFMNRVREGFLYVKNPMNEHQVSKILINPDVVDCIVFWTKNPKGIMKYLDELEQYMYYFQFTLTGYGRDIERNVPDKKKVMIPRFQELSEKIGKERVIWRYDPILFNEKYTEEYHLLAFEQIAESLCGYTSKCVISFVDMYQKNKTFLKENGVLKKTDEELRTFAGKLKEIAARYRMTVASCSESLDLTSVGIEHNCCIDKETIERLLGCSIQGKKDKNQRIECGCMESVEVGRYNTCKNGCEYCYATYDETSVINNCKNYDPLSPVLCGSINEADKITERKVKSLKNMQMTLEEWQKFS